jgi:hypothetical protein
MVKILWHRRETRQHMEKTIINPRYFKKQVYSTQVICKVASCMRRLPESRFSSRNMAKEIGERNNVES